MLTEIATRKDGGGKKSGGSAVFKAQMSFYSHMRRMKRKATSSMQAGDTAGNFNFNLRAGDDGNASAFNSDLDCVVNETNKNKNKDK